MQAYGLAVGMVVEKILEIVFRPFVDDEHRLALRLLFLFLVGQLALPYLYVIFLGEPP